MRYFLTACLGIVMSCAASAQSRGFVDINELAGVGPEDVMVDVQIGGWMLGLAKEAARESGEPDAEIIQRVESIRVKVFQVGSDRSAFVKRAEKMARDLRNRGWEDLATVRAEEDRINVLVIGDEKAIEGMVVMLWGEDNEAVLVNIAGQFRSEDVAQLIKSNDLLADINLDL